MAVMMLKRERRAAFAASAPGKISSAALERALVPAGLLLVFGGAFVWLAGSGAAPFMDAGGFRRMLIGFLENGTVDYMRWSCPTFIGMLPLAAPWATLFGTGTVSLQNLGILYGLLLVLGVYAFARGHNTSPLRAALLTLALGCFIDFFACVPTFMTDIPYAATLVWFFVANRQLEERYATESDSRAPIALWLTWGILLALAAATRSYAFLLVPFFAAQRLLRRDRNARFAQTGFYIALAAGLLCFGAIRLLTRNGFSLLELTSLPQAFAERQWVYYFHLREWGVTTLLLSVMALPALALCGRRLWGKPTRGEIALGAVAFVLAAYFWRKGVLDPVLIAPGLRASVAVCTALPLVFAPIGCVLLVRLIRWAWMRAHSTTAQAAAVLIVAHLLLMPIGRLACMKYYLPAYCVLLLLVAMFGIRPSRKTLLGVACLVCWFCVYTALHAQTLRRANEHGYLLTETLLSQGTPPQDIRLPWSWYCQNCVLPRKDNTGPTYLEQYQAQGATRYSILCAAYAPTDSPGDPAGVKVFGPPGMEMIAGIVDSGGERDVAPEQTASIQPFGR